MGSLELALALDTFSGRRLGKYEVLCRLSTGGMSEIFLAFQRGLAGFRKFVVLKQILQDIKGEEEFVRMFLEEAKITAAFTHPNIAQVYDLDIQDGELFLAMEFVPGATLVEVAKACYDHREPIPIGFTLAVLRDTALALHYAHNFTDPTGRPQQILHRDVAEKNVMVTYDGVAKLLDFGIAKRLNFAGRTMVGTVKGTSGYMSPEQVLGKTLDPRSDVFSLGVVLHELLTGTRLFVGRTNEDEMMAPVRGRVEPPSRQNPAISPALDAVTLKALQQLPEDRYDSAKDFARALERAGRGELWDTDQVSLFIRRLFHERRQQTAALLEQGIATAEGTGFTKVAQLLGADPVTRPAIPSPVVALPPAPSSKLGAQAVGSRVTAVMASSNHRKVRPTSLTPLVPAPSHATAPEEAGGTLRTTPERPKAREDRGLPPVNLDLLEPPTFMLAPEPGTVRAFPFTPLPSKVFLSLGEGDEFPTFEGLTQGEGPTVMELPPDFHSAPTPAPPRKQDVQTVKNGGRPRLQLGAFLMGFVVVLALTLATAALLFLRSPR